MMLVILQCLVAACILFLTQFIYKHLSRKWRNEPPGPWGLPLLGYSPFVQPRPFKAFMHLKSKYPDIFQADFGSQRMIFLNSYETVKEALVTKGDNFSGRQKFPLLKIMDIGEGIVGSEGPVWKEHRRFSLRTLRDFGLGRNRSEEIIQSEVHHLLQLLDQEVISGQDHLVIMDYILRSVTNVVCTLAMGEQPGYEGDETLNLIHKMRTMVNRNAFKSPGLMFPVLYEYLSALFLRTSNVRRVIDILTNIMRFVQKKIDQHEQEFDPSQESRDYIDAYLQEKHKLDASHSGEHTYTDKQLQREVFDLFLAGTDTTSNSLSWGLLLLSLHPHIQTRCHEEIDYSIGRDRQPSMKDKEQMPYIQAVLDEVQRYITIIPMGVTHRNFEADTIHGYHVPKNTLIVPFLYGVHHDPCVWERPEEFYPEHFLILVDGNMKYKPREELIPFSIGKRECLGESLAKMELFLFFVSILQKYEFQRPKNLECDMEELLLGTNGSIRSPFPHQLVLQRRS